MPFSISAADLLARIPLSAHTVLEVGCGDSDLLAAYRKLNPRARLLGIAADPVAAARSVPHIEEVSTADVEADPLPFTLPNGIDCIIYTDVLHRLRDPWDVIRRHAEALSPGGIMLICVPNIDYWRLTERRLRGTAAVDDWRHGFWPGTAGVDERLRDAGLALCDMTTREPDDEAGQAFFDAMAPAFSALGIDAEAYAGRAAASHLIYRVSKEPPRPMILSGTMLNPVGGVSHVRVVHPLRAVGSDPGVTTAVTDQIARRPTPDNVPRIFVLHRPALIRDQALGTVRRLGEAGYLTVTEFDDHPDHFRMMQMGGDLGFRGVHALQTSTAAMAEILRQYNPEVEVFPNAVVSLPVIFYFV
jgi:SAM-dependent methyltransferase